MRRERVETRSDDSSEADYYNRRADERAYMGEAYNGATKDWAIVDVPPGTERVTMDGVGGGGQEITWEKYNGVRRSKFIPEREREREREVASPVREREREREREGGWDRERVEEKEVIKYSEREETSDRRVARPTSQRQRMGDMWTEITKDLVVREAIEECGYDYEETEFFYYVIQYLRYVSRPSYDMMRLGISLTYPKEDVLELVELSKQIRRERQERIREIAWEREMLKEREERERERARERERRERERDKYEDERIIEREIIYEGGRRGVPRGYVLR